MLHYLSLHLNIMSQSFQILSTDPFLSSAYGYPAGTLITRTLAKPHRELCGLDSSNLSGHV